MTGKRSFGLYSQDLTNDCITIPASPTKRRRNTAENTPITTKKSPNIDNDSPNLEPTDKQLPTDFDPYDDYSNPANATQTNQIQSINRTDSLLRKNGIEPGQTIGKGKYGSADICNYSGKDPDILPLCKSTNNDPTKNSLVIIVKRCHSEEISFEPLNDSEIETADKFDLQHTKKENAEIIVYKNEIEIYDHLINKKTVPTEERKYPNAKILQEKNLHCLLLEYVPYGQNKITGKLESTNLQNFISLINKSNSANEDFYKKIFYDIFDETRNILDQLHQLHILHLDFASRNLVIDSLNSQDKNKLVKLKIVDFGLSKTTDENGHCTFPLDLKQCNIPFPIYIYDQNILTQQNNLNTARAQGVITTSVYTDLFSMRTAFIEVLGYFMGMAEHEIFNLKSNNQKEEKPLYSLMQQQTENVSRLAEWKKSALNMSDTDRLAIYINNLKQYATAKNDVRGKITQEIIECYSSFLYNPPLSANIDHDKAIFNACHQKLSERLKLDENGIEAMKNQMKSIFAAQSISLELPKTNKQNVPPSPTKRNQSPKDIPRNMRNVVSPTVRMRLFDVEPDPSASNNHKDDKNDKLISMAKFS